MRNRNPLKDSVSASNASYVGLVVGIGVSVGVGIGVDAVVDVNVRVRAMCLRVRNLVEVRVAIEHIALVQIIVHRRIVK